MNLIMQPCSSRIAQEHYEHTMAKGVTFSEIAPYLNKSDTERISAIYETDSSIYVWGVLYGSKSKWDKIEQGDLVLFAKDNHIFSSASVCYKIHNRDLAIFLWGTDEYGRAWEYIYFNIDPHSVNIPYSEFNKAVGYKENYIIRALSVLDNDKTIDFLNRFPIQDISHSPKINEAEYIESITNPLDSLENLDSEVTSSHRKEQAFLRQTLFKNKLTAKCAICGKEFPVKMLCCSHIKKRCLCSIEEKKDYANIVVPMCTFGCDALYEKGFLGVKDGKIVIIKTTGIQWLDDYLNSLSGKDVECYNENNKKYFDEHLVYHNYGC